MINYINRTYYCILDLLDKGVIKDIVVGDGIFGVINKKINLLYYTIALNAAQEN